jgi:Mg-chelatase subunit ChlI
MHLIDKHAFPKDYDFYVVNDGIDQRSSMLRSGRHRRRSSAAQHKTVIEDRARRRTSTIENAPGATVSENTSSSGNNENMQQGNANAETAVTPATKQDVEMDDLAGAMSALKFVPPSVKFGRSKGRGGFSRS